MAAIPGDWYASVGTHNGDSYLDGNGAVRFVYATQGSGAKYIVAKVWSGVDGDYASTARLVAAAPQLLAVCKLLLGSMGEVIEDNNEVAYSDLRMAIMRAEGET